MKPARKPRRRPVRVTPAPTPAALPVAVRIPTLREAWEELTEDTPLFPDGHRALPIFELRADLSHNGLRYARWLAWKLRRARTRKPNADFRASDPWITFVLDRSLTRC